MRGYEKEEKMLIAWILIALAAAGLWFFAIRPRLGKFLNGGQAGLVDDERLPPCTETCEISGKTGAPVRYECGHDDAPEFRIALWGEPTLRKRPEQPPKICSECLLKKVLEDSIRCADCGFAILPGEPVAVRSPERRGGMASYPMNPEGGVIVCISRCDHAPGFCGHWMGKGIRPAFPDGGNVMSQAFNSGKPAFVNIGPLETGKKDD